MKKIFVILIVSVLSASLFGQLNYDRTNNTLTIGGSESKIVLQGTTGSVTLRSLPTAGGTVLIPSVVGFDTIATRQFVTALLNSFSAMVYPSAGIPVSTGTGWATSITDNSVNWNTAFSQTLQWDGSNINLNAEAGRSSLGGTKVGQAIFTLPNPSAIRFLRINADNSVSLLKAADLKTALSLTSSDVSLGNVTNESKTTMFTSPVFTGTIPRYGSPVSDTLATRAYARSVAGYSGGGGGGTWGLITGNITEQADLSEVFGTKIDTGTVYTKAATNTLLSQKLSLSDTSAMLAPYPLTKSLPIDNWNTAYGWGDHSGAGYYTGTSTTIRQLLSSTATGLTYNNSTGVFSLTDGYTIPANTSITNWNAAHGWGNHASAGYYVGTDGTIRQLLSSSATGLTYTNSTGVFSLTSGYTIPLSTDITNWNTAFGWGDHSDAGYVEAQAVVGIVEGVVEDALEDAPIGVVVEDVLGGTTGRDRYMSPAQIESYVALHGGFSGGERITFTVGDPGAPAADDNSFSHSALAGKQIVLLRDGVESDYTYASGEITVIPSWQENEKIRLYLWPWGTWEDLSLETSIEQGLINSLIGYWKLDEGSGSTAVDEMSNSNGTVYGGTWVTGVINNGFEVSSASDAIYIPSNEDNLIDGPFSISFWVNLDEIASVRETDVSLFSLMRTESPNITHELYVPQSGTHQDNFYFASRNEAGNWFSAISVTAVTANTWYHIVAANGGNGEYLDIYINGVRDNKTDQAFTGDMRPADQRYVIGSGFTGSTQYGAGIYDEVMIFHGVLSALEVEYLYNDGQGRQLTIP
jgi:hypothetical protein